MKNRGTIILILIVLAVVFLNSNLTGNFATSFPTYTGVNYNTNGEFGERYELGNVDRDPEGEIDILDLRGLKNLILLRQYDKVADLNQDGSVDWTDYNLLANKIATSGSGYTIPRSGVCDLGETRCTTNGQSGTGAYYLCKQNEIGVPTFYRKDCPSGMRCRGGVCEFKELTPYTLEMISLP